MKKKTIISLLICCMTLGMVNTSCQDMLTPDSERHAYTVAQDTLYSYWGIIKSLQRIAERYVILNECRGDLVDGSSFVSDTIAAIINFGKNGYEDKYKDGQCAYLKVSDYYHVINSCNAYIARCDTDRMVSTGQQKRYMLKEYAQVMAIRAWVYMQLVYAYGNVPFYKEPMLTTDSINNFVNDPNHAMANAKDLADKLGPELEQVYYMLDPEDMFPQYNLYGNIHSMRTMFPLELVLGDLYLMQGDQEACKKAAGFYYNFLNSKYGGPLETNSYISTGNITAGLDDPQYYHDYELSPYVEMDYGFIRGRYRNEAITCIPSNIGRLDGMVFTDINRLFGFEPTLQTSNSIPLGSDEAVTVSLITLDYWSNGYRRELIPSKGYEALCDSQKYEYYIGSKSDNAYQELDTLPGVGDARRSWIYNVRGSETTPRSGQYILSVGDDTQYGKFVGKQSPGGNFTKVYPLLYRKATVWLRYAEAINRAGFPSYAFAILRNGLVSNHSQWFPQLTEAGKEFNYKGLESPDYGIKDTIYLYKDTIYYNNDTDTIPILIEYNPSESLEINTYADLKVYVDSILYQPYIDSSINVALYEDITCKVPAKLQCNDNNISFKAKKYNNYPSDGCLKALWYLDRRERENPDSMTWLSFNDQTYLQGYTNIIYPFYKKNRYDSSFSLADKANVSGASTTSGDYLTIGVHQRGCGVLRPGDPERWSSYNYVDMVTKKIRENHGVTVTKEQIYGQDLDNPIDKSWVIEAVEDLIIDEDALELAFEGCRFSDLARVAIRRGDNSFLAKRIAKRSGRMDMNLYNILLDSGNWYLPFPTE